MILLATNALPRRFSLKIDSTVLAPTEKRFMLETYFTL